MRYEVVERTRFCGRLSTGTVGGMFSSLTLSCELLCCEATLAVRARMLGLGGGGGLLMAFGVGGTGSSSCPSSSAIVLPFALCQLSCDPFVDLEASPLFICTA